MTVADNMGFALKIAGVDKDEIRKRVEEAAKILDLDAVPRPQAEGALRWPAPARRHGPRDRAPAAGVPHGRAAVEPRRQAARADPHPDRLAAAPPRRHHGLRHPRPGRGHDDGRPGRGPQGRPAPAGRHPARAVRPPGQRLRRRLHRLPGDEPARAARHRRRRQVRRRAPARSRASVPRRRRQPASPSASAPRTSSSSTDGTGLAGHGRRRRGARRRRLRLRLAPATRSLDGRRGRRCRADHRPRRRPHAPGEGQHDLPRAQARATCTCSTPRPASASATERSLSTRRWRCPTGRRHLLLSAGVHGPGDVADGRSRRLAELADRPAGHATMVPWHSRSPPSGPTPPCSTCRGRPRWRSGPRTCSRRCPAASRGTSSASSRLVRPRHRRQGDQGRPGPARVRHAAQLRRLDHALRRARSASSPVAPRPDGEPLDACLLTRHLQFSLPYRALFSQTLRPDTAHAADRRPRRAAGAAAPDRLLLGRRARCPTRCSAATPAPSRPTSSTPRPASCATSSRDGQREYDLDIARVNIAGELMDLAAGGLPRRGRRPGRDLRADRRRATASLWRELTERGALRGRRPVARRGADPAAQRARLRRRRARHHHRHRRHDHPDPAQGRRRRATTRAGCCA